VTLGAGRALSRPVQGTDRGTDQEPVPQVAGRPGRLYPGRPGRLAAGWPVESRAKT